jgi:hypothetical protein
MDETVTEPTDWVLTRAAEEWSRYVSSGLPLSPNMVAVLKRFPRLRDMLRVWGSLTTGDQEKALALAVDIHLRACIPLETTYRNVAEFAAVAATNAKGEEYQDDEAARDAAERRRQMHLAP